MGEKLIKFLRQSGKGNWSSRVMASITGGAFLGLFLCSSTIAALVGAIASPIIVESLRLYSKHHYASQVTQK